MALKYKLVFIKNEKELKEIEHDNMDFLKYTGREIIKSDNSYDFLEIQNNEKKVLFRLCEATNNEWLSFDEIISELIKPFK